MRCQMLTRRLIQVLIPLLRNEHIKLTECTAYVLRKPHTIIILTPLLRNEHIEMIECPAYVSRKPHTPQESSEGGRIL